MNSRQNISNPLTVSVTAPARLHLGFLDLHGGLGRRFGSLGLALEQPCTRLHIAPAPDFAATGPDAERALAHARTLLAQYRRSETVSIHVEQAIPAHSGLGSGTQLALAVGLGLNRLLGLGLDARAVAGRLDRGARSGIGIGAFEQGGFLVDGGRGSSDAPPPLLCRLPVPDRWRVLLIFDPARQGMNGEAEKRAFAALPPFPEAAAGQLCRLLLMQALPALVEGDCQGFGAAISLIQRRVGDHFAPAQGGRFASPAVTAVLDWLAQDAAGTGQSSWGPTGFALYPDETSARQGLRAVQQQFPDSRLQFLLCRPRNTPGELQVDTRATPTLPTH